MNHLVLRSPALFIILAMSILALTGCQELQNLREIKTIQDQRIAELQQQIEQKVIDNDQLMRQNRDYERRINELTNQLGSAKKDVETVQSQARDLSAQVESKTQTLAQTQTSLEAKTKMAEELANKTSQAQKELEKTREAAKLKESALQKLKKDLERVQAESEKTGSESEDAKQNLKKEADQLREKIKKLESGGAASSDSDFQEAASLLKASLKPHIDAKVASVKRDARGVVVSLSADYVFKGGVTDIDPDVNSTLDQIAAVYKKYTKKYVEVQGHTDSQPITNLPFSDNWALASARADKVVRYLAGKLDPKRLKSSSAGQYRPTATTGSPLDRRVEIILTNQP